ncbi:MAG: arylesterase [Pseudomonadota bacterium]
MTNKLLIGVTALCLAAPAVAETVVIAALGDSLTQGFGLPPEDAFVPELQRWLDAGGADVRIINAGVSGDTTAGGLARVGWTLTPEVDALIVALGGNDLLRGLDPALSRRNIEGILQVASEAGVATMVVGMNAPGNYGPEFKDAFDAIFPDLAEAYGSVYYPNFLAPIEAQDDRDQALAQLMQADRIHPNATGVDMIVEAMGPSVLELIAAAQNE